MTPDVNPVDIYVGDRLRELRERMQLSQAYLATTMTASLEQVERYERGLERVGAERLQKVARVLKVPPSYFFAYPRKTSGGMHQRLQETPCPMCGSNNVVEFRRAAGSVSNRSDGNP